VKTVILQTILTILRDSETGEVSLSCNPPIKTVDHAEIIAANFVFMTCKYAKEGWDQALDVILMDAVKIREIKSPAKE
jgi:hypothetical protein